MGKTTVTAVVNQKGGTAKTVTAENLGVGLAAEGKKVLLVDCDPQASLTISLGHPQPDDLPVTLTEMMTKTLRDGTVRINSGNANPRRSGTAPPITGCPAWCFVRTAVQG